MINIQLGIYKPSNNVSLLLLLLALLRLLHFILLLLSFYPIGFLDLEK